MDDIFGKAVLDYNNGTKDAEFLIHNHYGNPDLMPVEVYFRAEEDLSAEETYAINLSKGSVLEVGAGAGAICLALQAKGLEVYALEISTGCGEVMKQRGVKNIIHENFFEFNPATKYDTILLLMNGIGLCGELSGLSGVFTKLKQLLSPGGQIIFDSSDIDYLYEGELPEEKYYGEIDYQYEYNGEFGAWFKWLYVDFETARAIADENGLDLQLIMEEDTGQYLSRAVVKKSDTG